LNNKHYVVSASYSLVNVLFDKGKIEMYEVRTYDGFSIKAIRLAAVKE
jgi:hypothetical protein